MTAPKHLASSEPLVTLEDIERVVNRFWEWLAVQCLCLSAWVLDDPAGEWELLVDPIGAYGDDAPPGLLTAFRQMHEFRRAVAAAGTGEFATVTPGSSLLRPGVTAGLEVSR